MEDIKLSKEEIEIIINIISNSMIRVADAPIVWRILDKLNKMRENATT